MKSESKAKPYHHGDLFEAVLDDAERCVEQGGLESVSLRGTAKSLGVAHSAVFRHFSDKRHVLTELAVRSARRMTTVIDSEVNRASPKGKFLAAGLAYVNFAKSNPGPFRVVFREDLINASDPKYLEAVSGLAAILALGGHGGGNDLKLSPKALLAWSSVHGIATLCVDGSLTRDIPEGKFEDLIKKSLRQLGPILQS
ncbi:MAG: TetR/AcrR family transcriptional regulator [Pseudomonadota bacterium]